jgi:hypothetical protein
MTNALGVSNPHRQKAFLVRCGMKPSGIVTLLTDFGLSDWYVGAVKGVILSRSPGCKIVDISHEVNPGDIFQGAFMLWASYRHFPKGTVHMAVVDPGVGGPRRPMVASSGGYWFVGPDNGLLAPAINESRQRDVREITRDDLFLKPLSNTFHGRDVFAPVAAYLASGGRFSSLGPIMRNWVNVEIPRPKINDEGISGVIIYEDRFGNAVTNISADVLASLGLLDGFEARVGDELVLEGPRTSYQEVPRGDPLLIVGSSGYLEISINGGSAVVALGLVVGKTPVTVSRKRPAS